MAHGKGLTLSLVVVVAFTYTSAAAVLHVPAPTKIGCAAVRSATSSAFVTLITRVSPSMARGMDARDDEVLPGGREPYRVALAISRALSTRVSILLRKRS